MARRSGGVTALALALAALALAAAGEAEQAEHAGRQLAGPPCLERFRHTASPPQAPFPPTRPATQTSHPLLDS